MDKEEVASTSAKDTSTRPFKLTSLGAGFISLCLLFIIAFIGFKPDQYSLSDRYFPSPTATSTRTPTSTPTSTHTLTPTATATPDILLTAVSQSNVIFEDNFETNDNNWEGYYSGSVVALEDGRLRIASDKKGYVGMALCTSCPRIGDTYYMEADLISDVNTSVRYGLVFCADANVSDYYVFQINSTGPYFDLYKHTSSGWKTLVNKKHSSAKETFPSSNRLGVYFDRGTIKLYINNSFVYSYIDETPHPCDGTGFLVNDSIISLLADNLIAYNVQAIP